ncbi:DUF1620-domain-containing protein [Anaeromyces robustus]|uniref:ER membrane protein complex subunit 1 n=1 Tax=Anaeromyces robustus TaxID=1754192 RepID=A0A1Y1WPH9_9FUNG|nr:DUF1620-domain-containing protein [Anaeromyces robustus]|eukprot:ORX75433.1 DUF1620-domain-containing protein [Anaeromyces robustus]
MYRHKRLFSFILVILLVINSTFALYKDQVGVIDWYQAHVGTPKKAYFQKVIGRSNLIVATDHNVIANLNLKSNNIYWRHALKENDKLVTIAPLDNFVVSLSESKSSNIRIWNGQNGYLVNEYVIESANNENAEYDDLLIQNNNIYALIHGKTIVKINNVSRSQEGKFDLQDNNHSKLFLNSKTNEILAIGKNNKGQLIVSVLETNGRIISEKTVSNIKFEIDDVFFTGEKLVLKNFNNKLYTVDPKSGSSSTISYEDVKELVHVKDNVFIVKTESKDNLVKINDSVEELSAFENNDEGIISVFTNDADSYVSKTSVSKKESLVVEILNANTAKIAKAFEIKNDYSKNGEIVKVSLDSYRNKDGVVLFRIFTVTKDGSIHLYKESNLVWDSEESLTNIVDLKFIALPEITKDIPEAIKNNENTGILSQIVSRIKFQLSFLKKSNDNHSQNSDILKRDPYGFRQLLLFLTQKGKLICMETLTKQIIWTRFIGNDVQNFNGIKLTNIRSSAVQYPPLVAVIGTFDDNGKESSIIYSIDTITGENYQYTNKNVPSVAKYPYKVLQTFRLSNEEKEDKTRVIALVKSETEVDFYPNIPEVIDSIKEMEQPIYFNLNDKIGGNTLRGYKLYINDEKKPQIDYLYKKTFPENEVIISYGFKEPVDYVASLGKVLGNRNVLYKYLNPNVLAVATVKPHDVYTSVLSIYFLDTVKGSVIHHSYYEGGGESSIMKPQIIQYENMIVCTFWNNGAPLEDLDTKEAKKLKKNIKKGSQIVVFELYESEIENQKDPNHEFSSFHYIQPHIESKAYLFDGIITSIGVTTTRNSITNRELIVGLDNNELQGIHPVFINARRKITPPSNEDKQEGLLQYRPIIPSSEKSIMNYNIPVVGVKNIVSNPATLESTSLVAAYGLDIFLTRRTPSNDFDVLSEAFNKPILVITMVSIVIAVIYTHIKIKSNNFKKVWKIQPADKVEKAEKKDK